MFLESVYLIFLWRSAIEAGKVFSSEKSDPCASDEEEGPSSLLLTEHSSPEKLGKLGDRFFRRGQFEEALRCYNKAIKVNPYEAIYYRNRGRCYEKLGKTNLAIMDYEQSLELNPNDPSSRYTLGRLLCKLERFDSAIEHLEAAINNGKTLTASDESSRIISTLQVARRKVDDITKHKARKQELLSYLRNLIVKDAEHQSKHVRMSIEQLECKLAEPEGYHRTDDNNNGRDEIKEMESVRDDYLRELTSAFADDSIPEYIRDKIGNNIMRDPVITPSGITYEKSQILKHLTSNNTDPSSEDDLRPRQLRPNRALKEFIEDFLRANRLDVKQRL